MVEPSTCNVDAAFLSNYFDHLLVVETDPVCALWVRISFGRGEENEGRNWVIQVHVKDRSLCSEPVRSERCH